jgi:5-methylcytosine-specific restriction endonuclease McrA
VAWTNSHRAAELPADWPRVRRAILARDPVCRACRTVPSAEVDHIRPGNDHRPQNLQGLCTPCHAVKTAREAAEGRRAYWSTRQRRRPAERHPGAT